MVKTLKQYVKDKDLEDFEEDLMAESPPNTADAMKRYKAGKAGLSAIKSSSKSSKSLSFTYCFRVLTIIFYLFFLVLNQLIY